MRCVFDAARISDSGWMPLKALSVLRTYRGDGWRQDLSGFTGARVIRESGGSA